MIFDRIERLSGYIPRAYRGAVVAFFQSLTDEAEDGLYEIDGKKVYARVMSYDTKDAERCQIETHRHYQDIQFSLVGAEGIDIFRVEDLKEMQAYDAKTDVQLYEALEKKPIASVRNITGYFCMIPAGEPHRPMVNVGTDGRVKKCVIKIDASEDE